MLTSCTNENHEGFGWVNHKLIQSKKSQAHINAFGGEDRFWIGPEAGKFGIFFEPNQDQTFTNWQTPACIDSEPFKVVNTSNNRIELSHTAKFKNYQNFEFEIGINRLIQILSKEQIASALNLEVNNQLNCVGFTSENTLENLSSSQWDKSTGLLNIWILGMFKPSNKGWALLPTQKGATINTNYFKSDFNNRLIETENLTLYKTDGNAKGKIGLSPNHDKNVVGSFDFEKNILTIVTYETNKEDVFLNSEWNFDAPPYLGDVLNVYNDGKNEDGSILGPYYELETSSSSKELKKNERIYHKHSTFHLSGDFYELNQVCWSVFGADLNTLKKLIDGK